MKWKKNHPLLRYKFSNKDSAFVKGWEWGKRNGWHWDRKTNNFTFQRIKFLAIFQNLVEVRLLKTFSALYLQKPRLEIQSRECLRKSNLNEITIFVMFRFFSTFSFLFIIRLFRIISIPSKFCYFRPPDHVI
jgi:hypothetical protein